MNYAGIRYCPRCYEEDNIKTEKVKDGSVLIWCSQCEHTMRINDYGSDPLEMTFEKMKNKG